MKGRTRYFLSEAEFALCCAAAGISELPCFAGGMEGPMDERDAEAAVWLMAQKKLLKATNTGFELCPELSDSLRTIRDSRIVIDVRQQLSECNQPYCLLYGSPERFATLQPGERAEDFIGIELYEDGDLEEWLEDAALFLSEDEEPSEESPSGESPEEAPPEESPDVPPDETEERPVWGLPELPPYLETFLRENALPSSDDPDSPEDEIPMELSARLDCRDRKSLRIVRRIWILKLPLTDYLAVGTEAGLDLQAYGRDALISAVREMLYEQGGEQGAGT